MESLASTAPASASASWHALANRFLEDYFQRSPVSATWAGDHRYDGDWSNVSAAGDADYRAFLEQTCSNLAKIPRDELELQERIDAQILDDTLSYELFALDVLRPHEHNPLFYTDLIGNALDGLVTRNFGTIESRLASLIARLDGIPALVSVAKQRLKRPARINTETAIKQNLGLLDLVEHQLATRVPAGGPALQASAGRAALALRELQGFFEQDLLARSDTSFRLGRETFIKKLGLVLQEDVEIDALAASAHQLLRQTQLEMVATARLIWEQDTLGNLPPLDSAAEQKAFVKRVLQHVAEDRPTNQTIVSDAQQWLTKATAFVREQNLVRVTDDPVQVIEMPEYRRGVAVAYCDASGPLEQTPETFYAISPRRGKVPEGEPGQARHPLSARTASPALPSVRRHQALSS